MVAGRDMMQWCVEAKGEEVLKVYRGESDGTRTWLSMAVEVNAQVNRETNNSRPGLIKATARGGFFFAKK